MQARFGKAIAGYVVMVVTSGCGLVAADAPPLHFQLEEVSKTVGMTFQHVKPRFDEKVAKLMPWLTSFGASVSAADFTSDGYIDLYVTNGAFGRPNALYRNNGDGTFTDVAEAAGVADENSPDKGTSVSASWGDYGNDGCPDLFISKFGHNELYRNNCDGTFKRVTEEAGVAFKGNTAKAIWWDYNRDGCLDLYLAEYFRQETDLFHLTTTRIMHTDFRQARNGGRNLMYRNNCNGTFTEVASVYGLDDPGWSLDAGAADLDGDGWPDLYLANDFGPDKLLMNEGGKRFTEVRTVRGIGNDTFKGMNVDLDDFNHDGRLDIYVTNITNHGFMLEGNMLWENLGNKQWKERAWQLKAAQCGWSWGAKFVDIDLDGWSDVVALSGFVSAGKQSFWFEAASTMGSTPGFVVEDVANWPAIGDKNISGDEPSCIFLNTGATGKLRFVEVAQRAGITDLYDGRGLAVVDYDNNGTPDVFVANVNGPLLVYKNTVAPGRNWIQFLLVGTPPSNHDAVGAIVTVKAGGVNQMKLRDGGHSYNGQSDPRLLFGLGTATTVDEVEIRWPSGRVETLHGLQPNRLHTLVEGGEKMSAIYP